MGRKESTSSHYNIFKYWKDKCITSDGRVKIEIGYPGCILTEEEKDNSIPVVEDWGEPMCWCCGNPVVSNYDALDEQIYQADETLKEKDDAFLRKLWNHKDVKSFLQRCHIVPYSLKGSGTGDNLFLMCPSCHFEAPDCDNPIHFFKYVYHKRRYGKSEFANRVKNYLDEIGLYLPVGTKQYMFDFRDITTHGGAFKKESLFAHTVEAFIKSYNRLCEMTVDEVDAEISCFKWVEKDRDKKARPYINIHNKLYNLNDLY